MLNQNGCHKKERAVAGNWQPRSALQRFNIGAPISQGASRRSFLSKFVHLLVAAPLLLIKGKQQPGVAPDVATPGGDWSAYVWVLYGANDEPVVFSTKEWPEGLRVDVERGAGFYSYQGRPVALLGRASLSMLSEKPLRWRRSGDTFFL